MSLPSATTPAPELTQEDRARADFYALISRLFHAGPDVGLLAAIAGADDIAGEAAHVTLAQAWKSLVLAAAATSAEAAQAEYDSVYVGAGKAEITPYASHYLSESMHESVLLRLRAELAALGFQRDPSAAEYEDHFSGLCDVMRHLIYLVSGDAAVEKQKAFFTRYVAPCYASFCDAGMASPSTDFYKHVARFAKVFLDVETASFDMAP